MIDGGSETNCVSNQLVQDLKLNTIDHPNPYKLRWLDKKAEGYVKKQCLVSFAIGSYNDEILCDVLDMNVCHILLGRPWQYAKHSIHNGFTNVYTIRHEGKLKDLIPLPPCKTIATTTKQNKASCALTKVGCYNETQNGREFVHLLMKKTKEDQNQQQIKALKTFEHAAVDLELFKPMTNNDTELNKLHQIRSITCCEVSGFYFIEDTITDFSYYSRYQMNYTKQAVGTLQLQGIDRRTDTKAKEQYSTKAAGAIKQRKLQKRNLAWNLLNCYGILKTCNMDDYRQHKDNA